MSETDISSTPNPESQVNYAPATVPTTTPTPSPGQVEYNQNDSTIKKSDQQIVEDLFLSMQFPGLFPPNVIMQDLADLQASGNWQAIGSVASNSALFAYEQLKSDIISSMWDSFAKGVKELEELSKQDYIEKWVTEIGKEGPKSGAEYFAYLLSLSASRRAEELANDGAAGQSALSVQFNALYNQWFPLPEAKAIAVEGVGGKYPDPSFIIGALASNPDVIREAIGTVGSKLDGQLSVSPLADALVAVGPNSGLPVDSQAAAALIAALLYGGARNQADVETLEKAAVSKQPPQDMEFAVNFAKNILAIISHAPEGDGQVGKEQAGQNQMIRLMLSVMALNLVYRAGFGGMEGSKEFRDLLKEGGTDDIDPAIKPIIEQLVAQVKNFLPVDEPKRSSTLASLSEYIDSKDSTESMLATTRMFAASLKVKPDILGGRLGATSA